LPSIKKLSLRLFGAILVVNCSQGLAVERIVSLAPHTTELIYALGAGNKLVAVSDYSNYPIEAEKLPSVANYNGIDIETIMRLKPDLIVAWQGGNKPQDIARLASLGFTIYSSAPQSPDDISRDIIELGKILGQETQAKTLANNFSVSLASIKLRYQKQSKQHVFYYLWTAPLMTIGAQAWANKLIEICGASQIFNDSPIPYPEVSKEQVISRQPTLLIAAMKLTAQDAQQYWQATEALLKARLIVVNPDELHRFAPRLIEGLSSLFTQINGF
jgi:vitamin B12 transport system substrate-binding protein